MKLRQHVEWHVARERIAARYDLDRSQGSPAGTLAAIKEAENTLKTAGVPSKFTELAPGRFVSQNLDTYANPAGRETCFHKRGRDQRKG
jgi:hypothetical protein